jgi:hypothetical protein
MTGYVYAIESGDSVKIGWAKDPLRRLAELNVGSPGTHRLIGFARGGKDHERQIHRLCASERIRGEWFAKGRVVSLFLEHLPAYRPEKIAICANRASNGLKLDQFLAEKDMSRADFAKAIGVSEVSVTRYIGGTRLPQPAIMARIAVVTDGAVTPNDFLLAVDAPTAPIAANEGALAQ